MNPEDPTDDERYPTLTEAGRRMLQLLREHPHAPLYRNLSGNRLTSADVARLRAFEAEVEQAPIAFRQGEPPAWVAELIARNYAQVPYYRDLGGAPRSLLAVPPISRAELSRDVAALVPDDVPLERVINFRTSGTTGHPLLLPSEPITAASYLVFHKRALRRFGVELRHGQGQVGVVLLGFQRKCFTYVSVTPTMGESGLAKINLHPGDWRHPDDRAKYLDALAPEVYAGDPISFHALLELPLQTAPRALLSTSMALGAGLRSKLQERFGCPVLDLYSLNEAGPIAVLDPALGGHVLLQPGTYVEILNQAGEPVELGQRGEVTLTGGFNRLLPLLRYRTGDHAELRLDRGELVLVELHGRPPVRFRTPAGEWLNNIEVTHALARFALPQYGLHQAADGALTLQLFESHHDQQQLLQALQALFGQGLRLSIERLPPPEGKVIQYSSELEDAVP